MESLIGKLHKLFFLFALVDWRVFGLDPVMFFFFKSLEGNL